MYPENLVKNKVSSFISENLSFNIQNLMNIEEINLEYENDLKSLMNDLKSLEFIEIKEFKDITKGFININDNFCSFSFFNLPEKLKAEEILEMFNISKIERIYKDRSTWCLTTYDKNTTESIYEYIHNVNFKINIREIKKVLNLKL